MIQAQELRIGNWYNEFSIPKKADGMLIVKLLQIENAKKIAIDVSPISLTFEILESSGFERKNHYWTFKNFDIDLNEWFGFNNMVAKAPCKFVHQLQNLYFALTGTELTINL